jgi:hypothetical protein
MATAPAATADPHPTEREIAATARDIYAAHALSPQIGQLPGGESP